MREMEADRVFYPDANSTMRLSLAWWVVTHRKMLLSILILRRQRNFDKIRQYKGDSDFDVLPSVVECLRRKDFGRYAAGDGNMNVCFISDNDITGGNSGSGMFNGKGN